MRRGSLMPLYDYTMWQVNLRTDEAMGSGPYPERPGESDCAYYIRTGLCGFGMTCRFNHPPNRELAVAALRIKGGYPERIGQPECQYYLKSGTCKFGATCKFHHPRDKVGIARRAPLNTLGYPLRLNEKDCAYYLRTGHCKFGSSCKFNHPQPSSQMFSMRGSHVYPAVHSSANPSHNSTYPGSLASWSMSKTSFIPSPRWQDSSSFAQLILPHGMIPVPGWNATYPGQLRSVQSLQNQPQILSSGQLYGSSRQSETSNTGGAFSSVCSPSVPVGLYAFQRESIFPERPGQPECQFYMKTGDCKFGIVCRFHHPKERLIPIPNCMLSPLGLPLRPGQPLCIFYSRYGICKFGPNCKFDHPLGTFMYGFGPPSDDVPVVRHLLGSSSMTAVSTETTSGRLRRFQLSDSCQRSSGEATKTEESHVITSVGAAVTFA